MFDRLPADVLIELSLKQGNVCDLRNLFKSQTKIEKLTIVKDKYSFKDPVIEEDLFYNLKIEFPEWHAFLFKRNIHFILAKQTLKLLN